MAKNTPVESCSKRQNDRRDPRFHQKERPKGEGNCRSIKEPVDNIGCDFLKFRMRHLRGYSSLFKSTTGLILNSKLGLLGAGVLARRVLMGFQVERAILL